MQMRRGAVIAHRGASALVEFENTLPAFAKAIEIGADAMEFDVRRTADGVLVSFHDADFGERPIAGLPYGELQALAAAKGFAVPRLEEILELAKGRIFLDIELKEEGYEEELLALVLSRLEPEAFVMKSFLDRAIARIKTLEPRVETGLLLGVERPRYGLLGRIPELFPGGRLRRTGADFVAPHYRLLRFGFLARMRRSGYPVLVWTVNEPALMERLLAEGVRALITDRPDLCLRLSGPAPAFGLPSSPGGEPAHHTHN